MFEAFSRDIRGSLRLLRKNPGFAVVAVVSLALGIGANTAIFTVVNAILLHPLPVQEPSQLVEMFSRDLQNVDTSAFPLANTSLLNYEDFRDRNTVFSGVAATTYATPVNWGGNGEPKQLHVLVTSANYFDVLGVKPYRGRTFLPVEDRKLDGNFVVVVSYHVWRRDFGSDENLVGRTITLNTLPYTVIGIAPQNFKGTFFGPPDVLWVPLSMRQYFVTDVASDLLENRRFRWLSVFGRLRPGLTRQKAESGLKTLASALEKEYPAANRGHTVELFPLNQSSLGINQRGQNSRAVSVLICMVSTVLLIACANLANMLMAQAAKREKELSLRAALGAGRARLVRQLLTESLMLAFLGGIAGFFVALLGRKLLWSLRPAYLVDGSIDLSFNGRVLGFTAAISLFTGLLFGLLPALKASRTELSEVLKMGGRGGTLGWRRNRTRSLLVISEVALSVVALTGAGLFARSMQNAQKIDLGFDGKNLFQLRFDLGALRYSEVRGRQFCSDLVERVKAVPGVLNASLSSNGLNGADTGDIVFRKGEQADQNSRGTSVLIDQVSPDHFTTLATPLVEGRDFSDFDREDTLPVVIVNEALAKVLWPLEGAFGKRLSTFSNSTTLYQVVGVVRNSVEYQVGEDPQPLLYYPLRQKYSSSIALEVRTSGKPESVISQVRSQVRQLDRNLALANEQIVSELVSQSLWPARMGAGLLGMFGGLALVLASGGIYGVLTHSVAQRTAEIGVRIAIGAEPHEVLGLVLRQGMTLAVAGLVLGIAMALLLARVSASLLYGVSAADPLTYVGSGLLFSTVALLACYLPARRATRVDPVVALRIE